MKTRLLAVAIAMSAVALCSTAAWAANPEALPGAKVYQTRCSGCHSLDANKVGPAHRGVYGRMAGKAPNFGYSPALKASGIVWSDRALDQWLQGPQKLVKGSRMYFSLPDAGERTAVIAYLKATSGK